MDESIWLDLLSQSIAHITHTIHQVSYIMKDDDLGFATVFFALIFVPPFVTPGLFQARAQQYAEAWERSVEAVKAIGGTCVEVDYSPFQEARAALDGPEPS